MSQFLPESMQTDGQIRTPTKGPEAFLSRDEETFLTRMLSYPESFPPKFKSWLVEYLAVNMQQIPQSRVVGLSSFAVEAAKIPATGDAGQATTSITFTDLATVGPSLQVGAGKYVFFYGCQIAPANGDGGAMSPSFGSVAAANSDALVVFSSANTASFSVSRALVKDLPEASNTVTMKYESVNGGTCTFYRRWLVALRYGNA